MEPVLTGAQRRLLELAGEREPAPAPLEVVVADLAARVDALEAPSEQVPAED